MLKILKGLNQNKKEHLPAAVEASSESISTPLTSKANAVKIEAQQDADINLEKLVALWKLKKELGQSLTPEEVLQINGMEVQELVSALAGEVMEGKIDGASLMSVLDEALSALDRDKIKQGEGGGSNRAAENLIQKAAHSNKFRTFFVALMIFLKFAPAQGAEKVDVKNQDRTDNLKEMETTVNTEPNPETTYQAQANDFGKFDEGKEGGDAKPLKINIEDGPRSATLEMAGYFDTDSGELNEAVKAEIASNFQSFLSQITPDNVQDVLDADFVLYGSSDERPTSNWHGSNEELTLARLAAIEEVLSDVLKHYDFSSLPDDVAEELRAKVFLQTMPSSDNGPEKGVTYLADLHKDNGENYSAEELLKIKTENPELYKQLLDECRKITFSLSLDKREDLPTMSPKKPRLLVPPPDIHDRPWQPSLEKLPEYTNVCLIFDNSPSVGDSYPYIAELIAKQDFDGLKILFATFSNKLDAMATYDNPQEVTKAIKGIKYDGDTEERALVAAESALKKVPAGDKNAVFVITDEDFQEVSLEKIQKLRALATSKNADVFFYYADDKRQTLRQVSLDDLESGWSNEVFKVASKRVEAMLSNGERKINSLEKQYQYQVDISARLANRDLNPSLQKSYQLAQTKAADLLVKIDNSRAQIEVLRNDWESGSIERLLANDLMQDFKIGEDKQKFAYSLKLRVHGGELGAPALDLSNADQTVKL